MRKCFALIVASFVVTTALAQETDLKLKLEAGNEYKQSTESHIIVSQEINGQKLDINMRVIGSMVFRVQSVTSSGYDMDVRYDQLGFSMELPQGKMEFSSEKVDLNDIFSTILLAMKGKPFSVSMATNGKILKVGNVAALWEGIIDGFSEIPEANKQQIKAQIMNAYGEKAMKGGIEMVTAIFPDKPVRRGDKWTVKTNLESGMAALITTEYQFSEVTPDYTLIKGTSIIKTEDKDAYIVSNGRPTKYDLKGSMISEIKIDRVTGWTIEAKVNQDIRGDVYIIETPESKDSTKVPMVVLSEMVITGKSN